MLRESKLRFILLYFLNITFCHLKHFFYDYFYYDYYYVEQERMLPSWVSFLAEIYFFNLITQFSFCFSFLLMLNFFCLFYLYSQDTVILRISLMYCDYVYDISIIRSSCHGHGNLNLQIYRIPRVSVFHHSYFL